MDSYDFVCLQEAHGNSSDFIVALPGLSHEWLFFENASGDAGHTAILARKSVVGDAAVEHTIIAASRAQKVAFSNFGKSTSVWNIHNYGIPSYGTLARSLQRDINRSMTDPLTCLTYILGDFNFLAPGESITHLATPEAEPKQG